MSEITKKNDKELIKDLDERKNDLRDFRFGIAGSKTRDVKSAQNLRKEIARIKTEQNTRKRETTNEN